MVGTSDFEIGLDVKVDGVDKTILQMQNLMPEVRAALERTITAEAAEMRDRARALASGEVLQERTGKFVASIQSNVRSDETGVFGTVYSDDPRDPLFEYGGEQAARDILPNVKQALAFLGGSVLGRILSLGSAGQILAAIVHRPVVQYPKHPIIHAAFDEARTVIQTQIGDALVTGLVNSGLDHDIESGAHSIDFAGH
jgi:hypothetical protein